MVMLTSL